MDNQDKIFEKIKTAANKAEEKDFPGMEKVWARVDEKLDKKVLAKKSKLWQKIAIAASLLLMISVGYQFLKPNATLSSPKNEIVTKENIKPRAPQIIKEKEVIVLKETANPIIKKEAEQILKNQLTKQSEVVATNRKTMVPITTNNAIITSKENIQEGKKVGVLNQNYLFKGRVFDAISVHSTKQDDQVIEYKTDEKTQAIPQKNPPLMVIDVKHIKNKNVNAELEVDEVESVVVLKEPLYIINGVEYSEEELFGTNPTSPYAPLDKQEIETVNILQEEKAISIYGKKGAKGVVIITTKNKKPLSTSPKK
ncbi:MAG: hypothetical protein V4548_05475 [Bacteroidota bacterium]